jgi:hypothetical protein
MFSDNQKEDRKKPGVREEKRDGVPLGRFVGPTLYLLACLCDTKTTTRIHSQKKKIKKNRRDERK